MICKHGSSSVFCKYCDADTVAEYEKGATKMSERNERNIMTDNSQANTNTCMKSRESESSTREAFEKEFPPCNVYFDKSVNFYRASATHHHDLAVKYNHLWQGWQAATLAVEARIRELGAKIAHELWARKPEYFSEAIVCVNRIVDAALTEHKENQDGN